MKQRNITRVQSARASPAGFALLTSYTSVIRMDDDLKLEKQVEISQATFRKYSDFVAKRIYKPTKASQSFIVNFVVWFFIAIIVMVVFQISSKNIESFHWPSAAISAFPFVLFIGYSYLNIYNYRKLSVPNADGLMLGSKNLVFDSDGINETSSLGGSFYKWQAVEGVEENDGDIYIFVDKFLAIIVPESAFSSSADKVELRELISKYA